MMMPASCGNVLELGEKNSFKNSLDVGMNLKKGWKQGRDDNTQEDYSTM